ncbi:MAG: chromosome partitioning protein ParA [Pseudomonas sp.]|uniref:chromosome partitioning protein ParA n=1 Tax=Pseudomonas sp. TaxID=306 RepID=UPI0027240500|nr:chromosome partitioning protein ParA [Pseudomonas sp.]MDO9616712.1 chromosome partitioning protein ParA [Pseudomonas sp.]MDP2444297.1 chromosome partitioning protein ParA [Pseudomonas sp.]MDZ4334900.1 chromosome partitioning protein ParA [Pseudomonas sp.]
MSMQNKPQMVEAVLFFSERGGICKQMFFPEFEALLDGVVNMPEFADQQMRVAYVLINPRLLIKALVFFYLDFDEKGAPDSGWNIPLQALAERAGRGPDLGAGPIRLACRSQCPVSWHQMHLWDPSLTPGHNDLALLRDVVKRNSLGLLAEDDNAPAVAPERLQMASEDKWYAADPAQEEAAKATEKLDQEQRVKAAQLIKQQRLRITSLTQQHEEELAKFKLASDEQSRNLQSQIHGLHQALRQQEEHNAALKAQLAAQAASFQSSREEMTEQLRALERDGRSESDSLRAQFEGEMRAKIASAVAEYKEQIAIRDVELAYRGEQDTQALQEINRLKRAYADLASQGGDQILERLAKLGVVFVVYHPGAGHLTIPLQDIAAYQDNPMAYAAAKCFVSEEQYRHWLAHYQQPSCEALLSSGERCAIPIDRIDTPSRFALGESNCCARHKASSRLRTVS